ncbi:DMT family transporter [Dokdonia sp. PRO95]|uniref:DMT family transporter n=1 Tax=Dokdonia sp. PRO95 TaxID=1239415 RepID=UPI00054D0706|nr:DMT family transporter [Dokdonia sp. PRO95]
MQNDKLKAYLHFHLIVFIWGFTAVLGALITIDAVPLVWFRMGLASIFIFAYIKMRGVSLAVSRKTLMGFAIAGLVIAVHWLTFFGAIKESNVSITLAMMSTGAFFTALLEPIFYKRKVIWYELLFGAIVVGALYVIFEVETAYQTGILLALFSAFLSAVFTLINGKFIENHHPTKISFYELLIGSLCVTAYLVIARTDTFFSAQFFALPTMDWVYIGILASVCTAYAFIAAVAVMKHLSPYTIMLTINLEPVYGILLAFIVLGDAEQMSSEFYYGALVILAVVIANGVLKNSKKFKAVKQA